MALLPFLLRRNFCVCLWHNIYAVFAEGFFMHVLTVLIVTSIVVL